MATSHRQSGGSHEDAKKKNNSLRAFEGINTQAARQSIGDNQFSWLENAMPVGFGNMIVPPGVGPVIATWTGTAYRMREVNLAGVSYKIILTSVGSIIAVNLDTGAVTTVAAAATISGTVGDVCQWENSQAIIVSSTGYFSWDGATLTKWNGTVQSVTITAIGLGYTTSPTVGFSGGGGAGAAATCHISVGLAQIAAGGAGYAVGDLLTMVGGTFSTAAALRVSAVSGAGAVTGINLTVLGDYTASPANPVAVTGGYGAGATFTLNFGAGPLTLTSMGAGYTSAPTVALTLGGGSGATATANLTAVPDSGTSVATYAGRVWVSSGRTGIFSAPDDFSDFTEASAGGSFIMTDETMRSDIVGFRSANNFLFIFGQSSANVIADVSVSNGVTRFSNTNISSSIGTDQLSSVTAYYRALWFSNPYGIYAMYGSTAQKTSDDLDGIMPLVNKAKILSAGLAVINQILTLCFLLRYIDPDVGERALIAVFFNKKWFLASQDTNLTIIDSSTIGGSQSLYATNGTSLYKLFSNTATSKPQKIETKLWDMGNPLADKQTLKFGIELVNPVASSSVAGTIDTEYESGAYPFNLANTNFATWINNASTVLAWTNISGTEIGWIGSGYSFTATDVETYGKYVGVTINAVGVGTKFSAIHLQYEMRAAW